MTRIVSVADVSGRARLVNTSWCWSDMKIQFPCLPNGTIRELKIIDHVYSSDIMLRVSVLFGVPVFQV